jgi:Cdc6-like AAA superfamily ATPase
MEPLSLAVSILPLIDASYSLCELISDVKDGGKERMKLLNEVTNLCCTLDTLKERFDESEAGASTLSTNLSKVDGPIQQCHDIIASLEQKLTSSKNVAGRFVQQLKWNFDKRDVLQAVEQLHRIQATITQAVQQAMFTVVEQIQHHQTKTLGLVEEKQSKEIRDWLSPLNFIVQQKAIYDSHCDGTGSTFIESKEFENFKKLADSVLWCRGPPGAGKTYLSSITTHHLQQEKECKERQDIVLIVYCRYDDPACQIVTNILGDLLKQCLLRQQIPGQIPESLLNLRKTHMLSDTKPSCEELVTILAELIRRYRRCRIVIDALDEFGEHNDRTSLLKALVLIRHKLRQGEAAVSAGSAGLTHLPEQCCISLLIMSRHIQDIRLALRTTWLDYDAGESPSTNCTYSSHELSPIQEDVRLYIDWRINNDPSLKTVTAKQVGLKDEVLASIVQGSSSM